VPRRYSGLADRVALHIVFNIFIDIVLEVLTSQCFSGSCSTKIATRDRVIVIQLDQLTF
jgi:hypothetical protein